MAEERAFADWINTDLTEITTPAARDMIYIYQDASGLNRKMDINKITTTTSAAISKTIGSGGDYATFAAAIAALPNFQAHNITLTIKAGTTLTETCTIQNRHASGNVSFTVQAEKYFPTSGELPTADSATATTLVDAALTGQSDDYYNGCWILIVDGTGTDNGFVPITDYVDATGTCTVASWPGTQPDNTSRYLIVGALVDCAGSRDYGFDIQNSTAPVYLTGIGIDDADVIGILLSQVSDSIIKYCGAYNADRSGLYVDRCMRVSTQYCGMVNNNTDNSSLYGGVVNSSSNQMLVYDSALSDNRQFGARVQKGGYLEISNCFGDNNGTWGTYAKYSGQAYCPGTECSGSSGDHSNAAGDGSLAY